MGLFLQWVDFQLKGKSRVSVNSVNEPIHILSRPQAFRWLGLIVILFFGFCFFMALWAHFERPDQAWAFLYFVPFLLIGFYLWLDSFTVIEYNDTRIVFRSPLWFRREQLWREFGYYSFGPRTGSHYFYFRNGRKISIPSTTVGLESFLTHFHRQTQTKLP